jgi:hypothetical protein
MHKPVNLLLVLLSLLLAVPAGASPLFDDDSVLSISLSGPLSTLFKDKKNRDELDFVLHAGGVDHGVKVRIRGKSRLRVCKFPPLRINFDKEETAGTVFAGQNKLKLATHCADKKSARSNVLEEYAAYRIFNLISDIGYRVRLVEVTYTDTDERAGENTLTRYGYLIESAQELADRLSGEIVELPSVRRGDFNSEHAALVFVYQYLIGNTDWSLVTNVEDEFCCHNGDLFDIGPDRYVVPYDFDLSGLVDTWYAKPDSSLGIRSVTQRLYRGYCIAPGAVKAAITDIAALENDILDVIRHVPGLTDKDVEEALEFLVGFFKKTDDFEKLARSFERRCL